MITNLIAPLNIEIINIGNKKTTLFLIKRTVTFL